MKSRAGENKNFSDYYYQISLKVILKDKKGRILILRMPSNSSMAGYYDLPGGRIRQKEINLPYRRIIDREIKEEAGGVKYRLIERPVAIARHAYFSKKLKKKQFLFWVFFRGNLSGGKIRVSPEHIEYKWVNLDKKNLEKYFIRGPREGMKNYFRNN